MGERLLVEFKRNAHANSLALSEGGVNLSEGVSSRVPYGLLHLRG
jgi:hypothetical protein